MHYQGRVASLASSHTAEHEGPLCRSLKGPPLPVLSLDSHLVALQPILRLHSNYLEQIIILIQQETFKSLVAEKSQLTVLKANIDIISYA